MTSITNNYITNLTYSDETNRPTTPKTIILAKNGLFSRNTGRYFSSITQIDKENLAKSELLDMLSGTKLPELAEEFKLNIDIPKVPLVAIKATLAFYRWTYETKRTEAQVNFYWNENNVDIPDIAGVKDWGNDIYSYTPIQQNTSVITVAGDDDNYHWFRENLVPFLETHSHHTMDAFMSGTDRDNSYIDGLQLVFGHITSPEIMMESWATNINTITTNVSQDLILQLVDFDTDEFQSLKNGEVINTFKEIDLTNFTNDLSTEELTKLFPKDWQTQQAPEKIYNKYKNGYNSNFKLDNPLDDDDQSGMFYYDDDASAWTYNSQPKHHLPYYDNSGYTVTHVYPDNTQTKKDFTNYSSALDCFIDEAEVNGFVMDDVDFSRYPTEIETSDGERLSIDIK